jgi:hypothetical protein
MQVPLKQALTRLICRVEFFSITPSRKFMIQFLISALFVLLTLITGKAEAAVGATLDLGGRNRPQGTNLVGTLHWDELLWGQADPQRPFYGFYRFGARVGGSPTAAAFLEIAPIAPVVFEIQQSRTLRFFNSSVLNCETFECQGAVDRTDYSLKFAGAYENFILFGAVLWREVRTEQTTKPVFIELENFGVSPGFHRFFENTLTLGYQLADKQTIGVLENSGVISEGNRKFHSEYLFYQTRCHDLAVTGALGYYVSPETQVTGLSAFFALRKEWGERFSLW